MYKTKLTFEVEIETQFGSSDAISMIDILTRVPAITSLNVIKLETDYIPPSEPLNEQLKAMNNIPRKIR